VTIQRPLVALAGLLLVCAACTSEPVDEQKTASTEVRGVTDDEVDLSMIVADLSLLTEQNLAPDIGDPVAVAQATADHINADGGVAGGRDLVLAPHVVDGLAAATSPEAGRAACLEVAEEDEPFAAIITAAIMVDTIECVSAQHDVLTMTMNGWPDAIYEASEGRLFAGAAHTSAELDRLYASWPGILNDVDALEGHTFGIISMETPAQEIAAETLRTALEDLDYTVAEEVALPCPEGSQTCEQHDAAIERMKAADVDFVFLLADLLAGAATVQAAADLGFEPQWAAIGNNVTDTVSKFYAPAKDNYADAWGIDSVFKDASETTVECGEIIKDAGLDYEPGTDAFSFAAVTCIQVMTVAQALDRIDGPLTQAAAIEALEGMEPPMASGPPGSFGPGKHDAGDHVFISKYDPTEQRFLPVDTTPRELVGAG
jgi:hypothetical protein